MKTEILAVSDELMTAVFNGVCQGIILTLLVYLVLRLIGQTNAATRYWIWGSTLLLLIAIFPAQYCRHLLFRDFAPLTMVAQQAKPSLNAAPAGLAEISVPAVPNPDQTAIIDQAPTWIEEQSSWPGSDPAINPDDPLVARNDSRDPDATDTSTDLREFPLMSASQNDLSVPRSETAPAGEERPVRRGSSLEGIVNPVSWNIYSLAGFPKVASFVLLLAWISIALLKVGLLCARLFQIGRIKKTGLPAGPELTGLFARLRADLAVRRQVELKLCPVLASPVALGFFRPVILVPEGYASAPGAPETEHIMRHELAHVRRYDDWANLAQNFIQEALFFHPAVWWISRRLSLEREIACDDYVLHRGAGPRAYALLLAELAGRIKRHDLVFAQGVSSSKSQLQQRINMILNTRRNTSPGLAKARLGFVTASAALIALIALYSAPRVVLAQPPGSTALVPATPPNARVAVVGVAPAGALAPVAIVASADEPDATPAADAQPDVGPGPKFKPDAPLKPAPPAPAAIMAVPVSPDAPAVEIAGDAQPLRAPLSPGAPGLPPGDGSLEERIARLEKMVQSLMDQQNPKHPRAFVLRGRSGADAFDQKDMEKLNEKMNELARQQAQRAEEQGKRAAEQAQRAEAQGKRAAEMADRANKDFNFKWKAEADQRDKSMRKEGLEKHLEGLRNARENLQREVEKLDREIERVERDQERVQEQQERRSELQQEQEESKEETASVAESEEN